MPYTVTRQRQWPDGDLVVEVSVGGFDYTNPDALAKQFPGEFETFEDPEEAAQAALQVLDYWQGNGAPDAQVAHGATGGMTMPFSPCTPEELKEWAAREREKLPKCDQCGEILPEQYYRYGSLPDEKFCREYCADKRYEDDQRERRRDLEICDSCLTEGHDHVDDVDTAYVLMVEMGADMEDHLCDAREEPSLGIKCECACNRRQLAA